MATTLVRKARKAKSSSAPASRKASATECPRRFARRRSRPPRGGHGRSAPTLRSEEHTSELQSLMRSSYAVFCLKKKNKKSQHTEKQPNRKAATHHNITANN